MTDNNFELIQTPSSALDPDDDSDDHYTNDIDGDN